MTLILITDTIRANLNPHLNCRMYVCLCKAVTDRQIRETLSGGNACTYADIRRELGVATQCGKCGQMAKSIVETVVKKAEFTQAV